MAVEKISRVRQHTVYRTRDGKRVPGVTTILNVISKPALIKWANNMGLKGIDTTKYVDSLAAAGSLAHEWIQYFLFHESDPPAEVLNQYTQEQQQLAQNSTLKFMAWATETNLEPIGGEEPMVSEQYKYGGTVDLIAKIDGKVGVVDIKTAKGIYDDHLYQLGAYWQLVSERGYRPEWVRVVQVGRTEDEGFSVSYKSASQVDEYRKVFLRALDLYHAIQLIKRK